MKIAIVGTGIAGNVAAYKLRQQHEITVFEAGPRIGGHSNTIDVFDGQRSLAVDTGFIVFNDHTYPNFVQLLEEIGQPSQASEMSFSARSEARDFEYCGSRINTLFAQRSNVLRPSFHRMIRDILRFNESMQTIVRNSAESGDDERTLGEVLRDGRYSKGFIDDYLVPMAAAIWSAEPASVLRMPVMFLIRFFSNHGLLQLKDRPQWRVIKGGSREYVAKLTQGHLHRIQLNNPVLGVRRTAAGVEVDSRSGGAETFDAIFLCCHSDQALAILEDPSTAEREVLGAIKYQENEAVLHTDIALMPRRRLAWAAWNYHIPESPSSHVSVTYNMNILQRLESETQYCVTLNNTAQIDPSKVLRTIEYDHPVFSQQMVRAQQRQQELNVDRRFYCGAYWRNGFHEDGVVSALDAVADFERSLALEESHLRRAG